MTRRLRTAHLGQMPLAAFPPLPEWLEPIAALPDEDTRLTAWGEMKGYRIARVGPAGARLRLSRARGPASNLASNSGAIECLVQVTTV